ncbi:ring-cleaving dioxygenase [Brevibacillus ruminantium]|uniref:Ring-cleaving dioxygenase n=1 Tax=Brevibacillus ruminantium TaxID=2950604 RepID=A0ABY4WFC0_9BACL|nr:ring-cleaving dioxygenase [Brevibacillus ruminantium]USG65855.1 ring-cleaving dioxygenase [Brevibacillus ruminantium]
MKLQTAGIHHITAFVGDAQQNVDFYAGILGLRLVKKTVNFDQPDVYHLYFGDELGQPGTIITFFPWPQGQKGKVGGGQVGITTYAVPPGSLTFWSDRLTSYGIPFTQTTRFSETYLSFEDHDGLQLEIVEREAGAKSTWSFAGIPRDEAIKGFGGAVLYSGAPVKTENLLTGSLGMEKVAEQDGFIRFKTPADLGNIIDLRKDPVPFGTEGTGTVHHIAWRTKDDAEQLEWLDQLQNRGYHPTPVQPRQYFNSIYFRESGGILFEIATDPPGFGLDEELNALGEKLMLPEWYEPYRSQIERNLAPIQVRVPEVKKP